MTVKESQGPFYLLCRQKGQKVLKVPIIANNPHIIHYQLFTQNIGSGSFTML